ncbi:hypothetical protein IQ247_22510 [Plectonema cf. radiosum LEGE 06105]|uniref:Uncharacterized protein n=1 Tax=Plectonema cf. radiosum LEGE 06105 TaxID=945769 RepID=A0A8J7K2Z7_9CYAN|nr:hypothetical protein [Plectonema radiosum]MBE9215401.1 hypothetical protein [Plectonema cf. radiosum LEGE 06105]
MRSLRDVMDAVITLIDLDDDGSFMRSRFSKWVNLFDACWAIAGFCV